MGKLTLFWNLKVTFWNGVKIENLSDPALETGFEVLGHRNILDISRGYSSLVGEQSKGKGLTEVLF